MTWHSNTQLSGELLNQDENRREGPTEPLVIDCGQNFGIQAFKF